MADQHYRGIPARHVDAGIDLTPWQAVCPAHITPLRTAVRSRYLVDVLPAHTRRGPTDHLCDELDFLPAEHCRERGAADHRSAGRAAVATRTGSETLTARRR